MNKNIFKVVDLHTELIGKIAKLTAFGLSLADEYVELFGIGRSADSMRTHFEYSYMDGHKYEVSLMFIDEPPVKTNSLTFYWLKEVGKYASGDWFLLSLNQIMICSE